MSYKISVIVPVFNREKSIERCLDSLINQTMKEIEVIVINDGSTDASACILDLYTEKHENIKVIHQENKGVSIARNTGLKEATGRYIGFVDSDDYIEETMYEKLYAKAISENYDLVSCDSISLYPKKKKVVVSGTYDEQNNKKLLIDAYAVLWNKIFKRELLEDILFKENVWYEDVLFLFMVFPRIKKIGAIDFVGYNYVQNEGSITYTYNDKLFDLIDNMEDIIIFYKENDYFNDYIEELEYAFVRYLFGTFIKRLAKTKNFTKFKEGTKYAVSKVLFTFPNYKKNKYLNDRKPKCFYLKHFSLGFAYLVYFSEKNKLN